MSAWRLTAIVALCASGLVIVATPAAAAPTHLFVKTTANGGSDTANTTCSATSPCATLAHAVAVAATTATIAVGAGQFNESDTFSGKVLTITGDPGGTVLFDRGTAGVAVTVNSGTVTLKNLGILADLGAGARLTNGALTLSRVTVSNSGAEGIVQSGGTLTVATSTIADNTGAGITQSGGSSTIDNTTIASNQSGGIVHSGGSVSMEGTLLSNAPQPDCAGGVPTDGGYNLADDASCGLTGSGSTNSVAGLSLGSLGPYGGPNQTMPPSSASSAVDRIPGGDTALCTGTDERGVPRPQGPGCDVGAVELAPTKVSLSASPSPATVGQNVSIKMTVTSALAVPTLPIPSGFGGFGFSSISGETLSFGGCNSPPLDSTGTTACLQPFAAAGTYIATGTYVPGSDGYLPSSAATTIVVSNQNFFVKTPETGGSDSGNTTCGAATPCATIARAVSVAPSTVPAAILVGAGTFDGADVFGGKNLMIVGAGGGTVLSDPVTGGVAVTVSSGIVALEDLTVKGDRGDGIDVTGGTASVLDSTVSNNGADGISQSGGSLSVMDSTVADNALLGIGQNQGTATVHDATIADNTSGGVVPDGDFNLGGSLLADAPSPDCFGTPIDGSENLASDGSCNLTSIGSLNSVPGLAVFPLAHNGGPTETMAPASSGPAVGLVRSPTLCVGTDQRGVPRPVGPFCDAGAVELAPAFSTLSVSPSPAVTGQTITLTAKVHSQLTSPTLPPPAGTVQFTLGSVPIAGCQAVPVSAGDIATCTTSFSIPGALQLEVVLRSSNGYLAASASAGLTANAAPTSLFVTTAGHDTGNATCSAATPCATVAHAAAAASSTAPATISVGTGAFNGSDTFSGKTLTITGSSGGTVLTDPAAGGVAVTVNSGSVTLSGLTVKGDGGDGVDQNGGTVNVLDGTISGNGANGITENTGTLSVTDSTIAENSGVGIVQDNGTATVRRTTLAANHAGGIAQNGSSFSVAATLLDNAPASDCLGPSFPTDNDYNLATDKSCAFGTTSVAPASADGTKLLLSALGSYGGPSQTMPPAPSSPAVDRIPQGDVLCAGTDERGVARPQSPGCEAGAVELAPANVAVTASPVAPTVGQAVTLTMKVTSGLVTPALPVPAGQGQIDPSPSIFCNLATLSASGTTSCTFIYTTSGSFDVTGTYLGGNGYATGGGSNVVTVAAPTTLYVKTAAAGGKDNLICSFKSPCATVAHAASVASSTAPATINVGAGTFDEADTFSGKSLTISGAPGGTVITDPATSGVAVSVASGSVTLKGLTVSADGSDGIDLHAGGLTLLDSTVSNNHASGIVQTGGTLSISTSTVAANVGIGVINDGGTATIDGSTIASNGGGIARSVSIVLAGTLLSNAPARNCLTTPTDGGYNLAGDATCGFGAAGSVNSVTTLELSALGGYGGSTKTVPPSSAGAVPLHLIPASDSALCSGTDQRGVSRPQGSGCDIGALELAKSVAAVVPSSAPVTAGQTMTLSAKVISGLTSPVLPVPRGTVQFTINGVIVSGCQAVAVTSTGTATCSTVAASGDTSASAVYTSTDGYLDSAAGTPLLVN